MNFILRPITITYAKNFTNILGILLNKLLEDIIENNFETLIKATPAALSHRISKKIKSVGKLQTNVTILFQIIIINNYI